MAGPLDIWGDTAGRGAFRESDWRALADSLTGDVVLPGSAAYDRVRKTGIERFEDVRPQAVVRCAGAPDVASALAFISRFGPALAIRSGGHDFAGRSSTTGVVLDLSPIDHVSLEGTIATVGAGAKLADVYRRLQADDRAIPGGCGASVGIAGLTLGGGLGILGRTHGLTCDSLVRAQVVLADGRTVTCDAQQDADLFWGLRGAGNGHFGVVTELVFDTVPAPRCTAFELAWDYAHAARVLDAWQAWAPDAPDAMAASLLLNVPGDSRRPPRVTVLGAAPGLDPERTADLLDTLIGSIGVQPVATRRTENKWAEVKTWLADHAPGEESGRIYSKSEFFRQSLPASAVEELVTTLVAGRVPGEARELDLSPWAGAYNRVPSGATAFPHRTDRFVLKHSAILTPDVSPRPKAVSEWLIHSWESVRPWGTGRVYPNFPDPDLADPGQAYFGSNLPRLTRVKRAYDPRGVFAPLTRRSGVS